MDYLVDGTKFSIDYNELKDLYDSSLKLSDQEFLERLPEMNHLACIICFFKNIPVYNCLSDKGIIHELAHLMHFGETKETTVKLVRELFKEQLKLV